MSSPVGIGLPSSVVAPDWLAVARVPGWSKPAESLRSFRRLHAPGAHARYTRAAWRVVSAAAVRLPTRSPGLGSSLRTSCQQKVVAAYIAGSHYQVGHAGNQIGVQGWNCSQRPVL